MKHCIQDTYTQKVAQEMSDIIRAHETDPGTLRTQLTAYLQQNATLVRGSLLDYTAMPAHPITQLLSATATWIAESAPTHAPLSSIALMYPEASLISSLPTKYPHLCITDNDLDVFTKEDEMNLERLISLTAVMSTPALSFDELTELAQLGTLSPETMTQKEHDLFHTLKQRHQVEEQYKQWLLDLTHLNSKKERIEVATQFYKTHYELHDNQLIPKQTVSEILSTHILSEDRQSLIPISVILSENPYTVYTDTPRLLTFDEKKRLANHSLVTLNYMNVDDINLLGRLPEIQKGLAGALKTPQEFAAFICETPDVKLNAYFAVTQNHARSFPLHSPNALKSVIFELSYEKNKLLFSKMSWMDLTYFGGGLRLLANLSEEQCALIVDLFKNNITAEYLHQVAHGDGPDKGKTPRDFLSQSPTLLDCINQLEHHNISQGSGYVFFEREPDDARSSIEREPSVSIGAKH